MVAQAKRSAALGGRSAPVYLQTSCEPAVPPGPYRSPPENKHAQAKAASQPPHSKTLARKRWRRWGVGLGSGSWKLGAREAVWGGRPNPPTPRPSTRGPRAGVSAGRRTRPTTGRSSPARSRLEDQAGRAWEGQGGSRPSKSGSGPKAKPVQCGHATAGSRLCGRFGFPAFCALGFVRISDLVLRIWRVPPWQPAG
jgi:hypothetical protein